MQILTYVWVAVLIGYIASGCFFLALYHGIRAARLPGNDYTQFFLLPIYVASWPAVLLWHFGSAAGEQLRIRRVSEKMALADAEE